MERVNDLYNKFIDGGLFTDAELQLVTDINGYNTDTLNNALYARYGYNCITQMDF